jgi:poly(A) polymerase
MRLSAEQAPWLQAPHALAVLDALESAGAEGRFVGGCVRNTILQAPIDDLDVATPLPPPAVIRALEAAGLRAVPTGVEHGTVTAVCDGRPVEVTTLRRDVETDGRRAVVAFTTDWAEDAARRDFRLNALYADRQGRVYDPVGGGVDDAGAGRIVFVGDPETRIREDYLRVLRFFRFRAWYGRGEPDAAALAACSHLAEGLRRLSAERVSKELLKLLGAPDPRLSLGLMAETGVLAHVLPETSSLRRLERLVKLEAALGRSPDPLLRLAALLPPGSEGAHAVGRRLRLSNPETARLAAALGGDDPPLGGDAASVALYRLGPAAYADQVLLTGAQAGQPAADLQAGLAMAAAWSRPMFPLRGEDALASGARGPAVGDALRAVERAWVDGGFREGRPELLARLEAQLAGP